MSEKTLAPHATGNAITRVPGTLRSGDTRLSRFQTDASSRGVTRQIKSLFRTSIRDLRLVDHGQIKFRSLGRYYMKK